MTTLHFLQPALPSYRIPFFRQLNQRADARVVVHYAVSDRGVLTKDSVSDPWASPTGPVHALPFGLLWQSGALSLPLVRGDVVVLWGNARVLSTILLAVRARMRGAKVIWWGHYWSSTSRDWRLALRMMLTRVAHAMLYYTDREVTEYKSGLGALDKRPIAALNNGLDTSAVQLLRAPYLAQERGRDLLFIGRLSEKTRFGLLLAAMADPRLADARLNVIGAGGLEESWRQEAERLVLGERVIWHGATTDEAVIAGIANSCRLFVYPGEVGLSLIHGMAYGLPCVVHDDRWKHMPEIAAFQKGVTGRVFARECPEDLARVIASMIEDAVTLEKMSEQCLEVTNKSFNTDDMVVRFLRLLKLLQ